MIFSVRAFRMVLNKGFPVFGHSAWRCSPKVGELPVRVRGMSRVGCFIPLRLSGTSPTLGEEFPPAVFPPKVAFPAFARSVKDISKRMPANLIPFPIFAQGV